MTSKLTREQLHERARENVKALKMASRQTAFESAREEILADLQLAELALAAMDGEPVAEVYQPQNAGICAPLVPSIRMLCPLEPGTNLYRHAQQPVDSEPVGYLFHNEYGAVLYSISDDATEGFSLIGPIYSVPQPAPVVPGKWIPVSEQMPPSRHEVLVGRWWGEKPRWCCKWATYIPGHPDAQSIGWLIPCASWTPTHWMPLPASPKEVKP